MTSPFSSFIVSDAIAKAVKAIINDAKWVDYAGAAGGWVAAVKQIWESGKLLYAIWEKIETADGVEIHQPWMETTDAEIREYLRNLRSIRRALSGYLLEVFKGSAVQLPGNITAALISPKTYSTFIALTPSAIMTLKGANADDPTMQLAWDILAAITATGVPGTGVGMTNQALWQWALEKGTFDYWNTDVSDKLAIVSRSSPRSSSLESQIKLSKSLALCTMPSSPCCGLLLGALRQLAPRLRNSLKAPRV